MRRFFLFLLLCGALLWFGKTDLAEYNSELSGEYRAYTVERTDTFEYVLGGTPIFSESDVKKLNRKYVTGETIVLKGDREKVREICNRLGVIYKQTETVDNVYIVYGYSPRLKRTLTVNNALINVQITCAGGVITVSNPLNCGSF